MKQGWLLERLGNRFQLLAIGTAAEKGLGLGGVEIETIHISPDESPELAARYLGDAQSAVYLLRPDQHVAARWQEFDRGAVLEALARATAQGEA